LEITVKYATRQLSIFFYTTVEKGWGMEGEAQKKTYILAHLMFQCHEVLNYFSATKNTTFRF